MHWELGPETLARIRGFVVCAQNYCSIVELAPPNRRRFARAQYDEGALTPTRQQPDRPTPILVQAGRTRPRRPAAGGDTAFALHPRSRCPFLWRISARETRSSVSR